MKKIALVISASAVVASASMISFGVEAGYYEPEITGEFRYTDNGTTTNTHFNGTNDTSTQVGAFLEHPIPIIPNIRLDYTSEVSFTGTDVISSLTNTVKFAQLDTTLYYEVLDNSAIDLDIGISGKWIDGSVSGTNNQEFELLIPMGYAATKIKLPVLPLRIDGDVKYAAYNGNSISDMTIKAVWEVIAGLEASAGYRYNELKLDESDVYSNMKIQGAFVGIGYRF
jgi:outer membrane protein